MNVALVLTIMFSIPIANESNTGDTSIDNESVTITTTATWDDPPADTNHFAPIAALPVPSAVPSTPHYLCEFEDPAECMWDYGEKRRLPRPAPSQAPEVDWTKAVTIREVESINFAPPAIIMWPNTGDVLINLPTPGRQKPHHTPDLVEC